MNEHKEISENVWDGSERENIKPKVLQPYFIYGKYLIQFRGVCGVDKNSKPFNFNSALANDIDGVNKMIKHYRKQFKYKGKVAIYKLVNYVDD